MNNVSFSLKGIFFFVPLLISCLITFHCLGDISSIEHKTQREFPLTNFSKHSVNFLEIRNDGTGKNSIPPIKKPKFSITGAIKNIGGNEPVISVTILGESRAYPLRMLIWHEVVNDNIGGVPILITYSPLGASIGVFHRQLDQKILSFGNTGRLRHFNTIIFDRETESWWQQFTGEAIIGDYLGRKLKKIPYRLEAFEVFRKKTLTFRSKVMVPINPDIRNYGTTPFIRMDTNLFDKSMFPYKFPLQINPVDRVIVIDGEAWPRQLLVKAGKFVKDKVLFSWWPGQNSVHDTHWIPFGKDIGNISVIRNKNGKWVDAIYNEVFAFTFAAFEPEGKWHLPP